MWSQLITDNKPQCTHTDVDPAIVKESNPKPMIGFTAIAQERGCCLCGATSPLQKIMFSSHNKRNRRKDYPKYMKNVLLLSLYSQGNSSFD